MRGHRRRLPHLDAPGAPQFVTWCLSGSLPPERVFQREHLTSAAAFVTWDRLLDACRTGSKHLGQSQIAELVTAKLLEVEVKGLCSLDAFVVMPNHVHVLWAPAGSLSDLMKSVKGSTAMAANRILGRSGQKFWQDEYFDRLVRDEREASRIRAYIENNPVRACLASASELYRWSSAYLRSEGGRVSTRAEL